MERFDGFDSDTLFLLSENQFCDSKEHYESVKDVLKRKATEPMRAICAELSDQLFEIDSKMNLIPSKMVSRIRRDTRFSKNKQMYRSNMWAMFMRNKHEWKNQPCMWFEFTPVGYTMGVGTFGAEPSFLEVYRKVLSENQDAFRTVLSSVLSVGAVPDIETYKRPKEGNIAPELSQYYNAKCIYFVRSNSDVSHLFDGSVLDELKKSVAAFAPMYKFLLTCLEKSIEEKGQDYE